MQVQTKSTVGKKLAALRKARGLSQEKLAEELLVSRQAISRWELDTVTPGADNLGILSKAFGITVDQLLDENISAEQIVHLAGENRQRKGQDSPAETIERQMEDRLPKNGNRKDLLLVGVVSGFLALTIFAGLLGLLGHIRERKEITPLEAGEIVDLENDGFIDGGTFTLAPMDD